MKHRQLPLKSIKHQRKRMPKHVAKEMHESLRQIDSQIDLDNESHMVTMSIDHGFLALSRNDPADLDDNRSQASMSSSFYNFQNNKHNLIKIKRPHLASKPPLIRSRSAHLSQGSSPGSGLPGRYRAKDRRREFKEVLEPQIID